MAGRSCARWRPRRAPASSARDGGLEPRVPAWWSRSRAWRARSSRRCSVKSCSGRKRQGWGQWRIIKK
uniref:Uncharacterized protein n=1 Tax=Arundo donax TaxID=35708 RepID=A0A0A9ECT1_ARUDO